MGVLVIAVVFINLGFWQLERLQERQLENSIADSRYSAEPEELETLVNAVGGDIESLRYRRATVTGRYDTAYEVLTRNQVYQEQAGFHIVDPLLTADGGAVLVNRGWIPLSMDNPPIVQAAPPDGTVTLIGWLSPTQTRPALGPTDPPEGDLDVLNRIDIGRIEAQTPYELDPVYLVLEGEQGSTLPVPLPPPSFDDEGSHLAYAIQWFGFTIIGVVGYGFLIRKSLSKR